MTWHEFYAARMNPRYWKHIEERYALFLNYISLSTKSSDRLHEAGCGAANISRVLRTKLENRLVLTDRCPEILKLAKINMQASERHEITTLDLLEQKSPDAEITFSHGVLEHFTDEQIRLILKNQLHNSEKVVHYVPSAKYLTPSFGDERLLTPDQWNDICKPNDIIEFNDGYDLILTWSK